MSVPMYVLMTEKDYDEAIAAGEEIENIGPDADELANSRDFGHYASYVSSVETPRTLQERIETAEAVKAYLNRNGEIAVVNKYGVICLRPDAGIKYAEGQLKQLKEAVENMTPVQYADTGEYKLRMAIRDEDIFAYPINYTRDAMPVGEYLQTMDAFIHNLYYANADKNEKEYRFVVTQTMWLHS